MNVDLAYDATSAVLSGADDACVGFAASLARPVRFVAEVRSHALELRIALQALGQVIWSDDTWLSADEWAATVLDPIVTVHPDRVFFEAFSQDLSAYAQVVVDRACFETSGDVRHGTTNIDFTWAFSQALGQLRSRRRTTLAIGAGGVALATEGHGTHVERKVPVPEAWLRAFVQLQAAMAMPGTRLQARPVDLVGVLRYLQRHKARTAPRALRYELRPGEDGDIVLEPWEERFRLKGAAHNGTDPRTIRTWGRRRLALLDAVLPYATSVDVYLKGRALPSFYVVHLPGVRFVLGLSGFAANAFAGEGMGGLDALLDDRSDPELVARVHGFLAARTTAKVDEIATELGVDVPTAARAAARLCREARALYDVERREWRIRELLAEPLDVDVLFPPDPRREEAARLDTAVTLAEHRERRKVARVSDVAREIVHRDWCVEGRAGGETATVVQNDEDRVIFGTCTCTFFAEHLLARGPCAHMLALVTAAADRRRDLPSSLPADPSMLPPSAAPAPDDEPEDDDEEDDA